MRGATHPSRRFSYSGAILCIHPMSMAYGLDSSLLQCLLPVLLQGLVFGTHPCSRLLYLRLLQLRLITSWPLLEASATAVIVPRVKRLSIRYRKRQRSGEACHRWRWWVIKDGEVLCGTQGVLTSGEDGWEPVVIELEHFRLEGWSPPQRHNVASLSRVTPVSAHLVLELAPIPRCCGRNSRRTCLRPPLATKQSVQMTRSTIFRLLSSYLKPCGMDGRGTSSDTEMLARLWGSACQPWCRLFLICLRWASAFGPWPLPLATLR